MSLARSVIAALALGIAALGSVAFAADPAPAPAPQVEGAKPATTPDGLAIATFASGCFWCTESDFDKVTGVVKTISGYMGGFTAKPDYHSVSTGRTGHAEVLQVTYDPNKVTYQQLLEAYWHNTDILDGGGQFCDRGSQYRPVIFAHSDEQLRLATEDKEALDKSGKFASPVAVEIVRAGPFTPAEDYHQDYYKKNPLQYKIYRFGCGRDARLEKLWGTPRTH